MYSFLTVIIHSVAAAVFLFPPGSLYFANIVEADAIEGKHYVCTIQNDKLRSMSQGDDAVIVPYVPGTTRLESPNPRT